MSESNLYYIYIDSKIEGTIDQLMNYFQANIFHADDCICIYFKYYKNIEKYINNTLALTTIRYNFIYKNSDFNFQKNKVVFYLFNAQSNCRVVAKKDLTHVFVTHGESHKLASIKPICRIYDFVVTSGQVGVDRFLKAGIFNEYTIEHESKVIKMGNTFIGQHIYQFDRNSRAILYAPTWEGGVPQENYSSLNENISYILKEIINSQSINKLYIQLHPNSGHRDLNYIEYVKIAVKRIKKLNIELIILKSKIQLSDYWNFKGCKLKKYDLRLNLQVQAAIVDISAMEMQLISTKIPTIVLYQKNMLTDLIIPSHIKHLYNLESSIDVCDFGSLDITKRMKEIEEYRTYLLSYQHEFLESMNFRQRIGWLCEYVVEKKSAYLIKCLGNY